MSKGEIFDSISKGVRFAGRMASKGAREVGKTLIGGQKEPDIPIWTTGLYYQRHMLPFFGSLDPRIEFFEPQRKKTQVAKLLKNLTVAGGERAFLAACISLMHNDPANVYEKLALSIEKDPKFTDSYFLLGCVCLGDRNYAKAEDNFRKCRLLPTGLGDSIRKYIPSFRMTLCLTHTSSFSFCPDIVGLNLLLSLTLRGKGELESGIRNLEELLSLMPQDLPLLFFLSCYYYEAGWNERIVNLLKELIPEDNLGAAAITLLAKAWINRGSATLAEAILQKAKEIDGIDPHFSIDLEYNLDLVQQAQGRSMTLRVNPSHEELVRRLGLKVREIPLPSTSPPIPQTAISSPPDMPPSDVPPPPDYNYETGAAPVSEPGIPRLVSRDGRVDFPLAGETVVIGRESGDITIPWDKSSSRQHARLVIEGGTWMVEDLGSTNGTWINRHRISKKVTFNRGDTLRIGEMEFYLS